MLQTDCEVFKMRNRLKNVMKDRLNYCLEWKQSIDLYLANKEISKKASKEYYKSKPVLRLIINLYYIPINLLRLFNYLRILHEYQKNEIEIKVLSKELENNNQWRNNEI